MAAALKIMSLELTWDGLADIWDTEALTLAPLNVVRMYGSKYFCSCRQIVQLINSFDPNVPAESLLRIGMTQCLFTRLVDVKHFADVLRQMTPSEQVQTMRRLGFQNCINFNRRDYMHLNGLCFFIRIGVKEVSAARGSARQLQPRLLFTTGPSPTVHRCMCINIPFPCR